MSGETRDALRHKNEKLRAAIRRFVAVQEAWLDNFGFPPIPKDWADAYNGLKELMGSELPGEEGRGTR